MHNFDYDTYFFGFYNGVAWGVIGGIVLTTLAFIWAARKESRNKYGKN